MHQKMDLNRLFPRNRYGRIALTLSGTFFLAVSIFPLILFLFHAPVPQGAFAWLFRILLTEFFTATPRAGCEPSFTIDLLGYRRGDFGLFTDTPTTLSYARVHVGESLAFVR